ncbi:MAG: hypothetical protein H8E44_00565 [Planctomycetes bacterium]|nr:hypothetical protein [Planctomycetota bacterium]
MKITRVTIRLAEPVRIAAERLAKQADLSRCRHVAKFDARRMEAVDDPQAVQGRQHAPDANRRNALAVQVLQDRIPESGGWLIPGRTVYWRDSSSLPFGESRQRPAR